MIIRSSGKLAETVIIKGPLSLHRYEEDMKEVFEALQVLFPANYKVIFQQIYKQDLLILSSLTKQAT